MVFACTYIVQFLFKNPLKLLLVFVLCFFCYMGMGYLASRDSSSAVMNWVEQGVNCLGQALLLAGVIVLHKAGLRELEL